MSAPAWMTDLPEEMALMAVLLPSLLIAHVVGNALVEGSRRHTGKVLLGAGLMTLGGCLAGSVACDGDKRGLCAFSRSPSELLKP